jgi:mono/diheme cytochrome c family protein
MSRLSKLALLALVLVVAAPLAASSNSTNTTDTAPKAPTFYKDVLPILQQSCQDCHRPGGANLGGMVAPMAFNSYDEVRPWARGIARQVEARRMPPWHASDAQHGVFANERTISDVEVETLLRWANDGAPAGDPAEAPPAREWPKIDWLIGEPDLVVNMGQDEKYFVEDDVEDIYVNFFTPITTDMLSEPRWIRAVEFRPGSSVVHHIVAPPLGGIAPGNQPTVYNDGYGTLLKPGDRILWNMHYHKEPGAGTGAWDQSKVAIRFYPPGYTPEHPVVVDPLAKMDFVIPPGDPAVTYTVTSKFERDSLLLSLLPHMHLRGKSAKYVARYPDGTEEVLLEVPRYDFNWQTSYEYPVDSLKKLPAGTEVDFIATWDNSADNPHNPDPTVEVRFGEPTTAEMMFGFLTYADAEPGYVPDAGGWLGDSRNGPRNLDPEQIKKMLKERMGIDWDTLNEEQRQQILERFRQGGEGQSSSGGR